ncbi:MAG: hypothetical protein SO013_00485 [Prevotella sp.]|nr:hypothetical protein [Prevotella sp.]
MKPKDICKQAWIEIGSNFKDFKMIKNGQILKKISKNKDLTFLYVFKLIEEIMLLVYSLVYIFGLNQRI